MRNRPRRRTQGEQGAAALEFGLVSPVVFAVLFAYFALSSVDIMIARQVLDRWIAADVPQALAALERVQADAPELRLLLCDPGPGGTADLHPGAARRPGRRGLGRRLGDRARTSCGTSRGAGEQSGERAGRDVPLELSPGAIGLLAAAGDDSKRGRLEHRGGGRIEQLRVR